MLPCFCVSIHPPTHPPTHPLCSLTSLSPASSASSFSPYSSPLALGARLARVAANDSAPCRPCSCHPSMGGLVVMRSLCERSPTPSVFCLSTSRPTATTPSPTCWTDRERKERVVNQTAGSLSLARSLACWIARSLSRRWAADSFLLRERESRQTKQQTHSLAGLP